MSYRAAVDHTFPAVGMVYASYNRGFKSGVYDLLGFAQPGFDPDFPDGRAPTAQPVDPEILETYEIGAKLDLLGDRLRLNIAVFHNDFRNIQLLQIVTGGTQTLNAGSAKISGLEAEFVARATDQLTVRGGLSLLHGEYDRFPAGPLWVNNPAPFPAAPLIVTNGDLGGNETIQTPPVTASLALSYEAQLPKGQIAMDLSYYYNGGFFWEPDQSIAQPSYHLVNGSVSWSFPRRDIELRFRVRNLLGEKYFTWAATSAVGPMYSPAAPRTFGLEVSYHFGG